MDRTTLLSFAAALCLTGCAHSSKNEVPPPVDVDVEPTGVTENVDAGQFGLTEVVQAGGATVELPRSFDTQSVDTAGAVRINDRWMPEVQLLMSQDERSGVSVSLAARPIDPDSGEALVSDELEREAERSTRGGQTWFHIRRESAPWWRTVIFVPVEDTMWVVDFIGNALDRERFDDFVMDTMEQSSFSAYRNPEKLDEARSRAALREAEKTRQLVPR